MFKGRMKAVLLAAVLAGAVLVAPTGAGASGGHATKVTVASGALSDLSPTTADPTDGARAAALAISRQGHGSFVLLRVWGINRSAAGTRYGAHIHVGPCVPGDGAAAGPHYNATGGAVVDARTEVWLDVTVRANGGAIAAAGVPFVVPAGGARSIVIHAMPTMPNGTAGGRLACLPLEL